MNQILNILPQTSKALPLYFITMSDRHNQETVKREHGFYNLHQFLFILEGEGELVCRGKTYPLRKGNAFLIAPLVPHHYSNRHGLVSAYITVKGSCVDELLSHYDFDGFLYCENVQVKEYAKHITHMTHEYFQHKREPILSSMTYELVVKFMEEVCNTDQSPIEQIALYIERNFATPLTLDELAKLYQTSVSKLCKDFKTTFGCTVFQHILDLRLTYAHNYLESNPHAHTKTAALNCGFSDISYFCRAYKQKFGVSPKNSK